MLLVVVVDAVKHMPCIKRECINVSFSLYRLYTLVAQCLEQHSDDVKFHNFRKTKTNNQAPENNNNNRNFLSTINLVPVGTKTNTFFLLWLQEPLVHLLPKKLLLIFCQH